MGGEGGIQEPDPDAPTIVSVSPADRETGVLADRDVVITFSEPMDRVATVTALVSGDVTLSQGRFTWSANDTVLTLELPPFAYARGDDPASAVASSFRFTVGTGAQDVAGNHLARPFDFAFRTLREITQILRPVRNTENPTNQYWAWTRTLGTSVATICGAGPFTIGSLGGDANLTVGYVAMDIDDLPDDIVDFDTATFVGFQEFSTGIPFTVLGAVRLTHLLPLPINQGIAPSSLPTSTTILRDLGPFSSAAESQQKTRDVLVALEDDYANRSQRSGQSTYGLAFEFSAPGPPFDPHHISFNCASFVLVVEYLIP